MQGANNTTRAIVAHPPENGQLNWRLENVTLRELGPDELLIRIVATGICHTDVVFGLWPHEQISYPKVLGHEGSGFVVKAGSNVRKAAAGDPVLLSFQNCKACHNCEDGHPAFCDRFASLNYDGESDVYTTADNGNLRGSFFGQSSFANLAIVKETSVVNVARIINSEEELKILAPLGCGFQTGMGTVDRIASAGEKDTVVILGLGGVGLVSIMAAKLKNCKTIIGVDRLPNRLELAKELGATHIINTASEGHDLELEVRKIISNGSTVTVDTTGNMALIRAGMAFTANRGQMILVGVPPVDGLLDVHLIMFMQTGKTLRGSIEGDVIPAEYIPNMIKWYREGRLPLEKLIKTYKVEDFETALADIKSGATVKPILLW
ncbi:chaperonin 10-like protein [Xylariales sp. PMI_506]|nr:chaperonin 10-like protein [Xylariales sp. PMI_506]